MALAYTAPTWEDGSGTGISASQLQALSNCMEGIVQGSDKAIHSITFNNGIATITYVDGSVETNIPANMKGISSIAKTGTVDLVDTYTVTYTDGTTFTYTVTNGRVGQDGRDGAIQYTAGTGITISEQNVISADAQPQEQADWEQSDNTKVDYIKNKPSIPSIANCYQTDDNTLLEMSTDDYVPIHSYQSGNTGARQISYPTLKSDINANCYETNDSTVNAIADSDYVPLLDMSMPGDGSPVKALFSTIKSTLKSYFDGIYAAITALGTYESGATASRAYAIGEHFYKNGKFCTAKTAIAQGAQFTLNTNYVEGTVAEDIVSVYAFNEYLLHDQKLKLHIYSNTLTSDTSGFIILPSNIKPYLFIRALPESDTYFLAVRTTTDKTQVVLRVMSGANVPITGSTITLVVRVLYFAEE